MSIKCLHHNSYICTEVYILWGGLGHRVFVQQNDRSRWSRQAVNSEKATHAYRSGRIRRPWWDRLGNTPLWTMLTCTVGTRLMLGACCSVLNLTHKSSQDAEPDNTLCVFFFYTVAKTVPTNSPISSNIQVHSWHLDTEQLFQRHSLDKLLTLY